MNLKPDTIYRDREGSKIGPLEHTVKRPGFPWFVRLGDKKVRTFTSGGCYHADGTESPYDLVAEDIPEPRPNQDVDQVNFESLQRGVARIWDSYKLLP